ncbi:hypothetical protein AYI69_g10512 [Smittium culicis]|uniref:Uncharacterized protein n=1 Tax=Smittium culicis TaxID=133412 RepID=A0A1R1X556_9FUNG|nr:hypothetical protein AYI69_g10512 [Smittium culicis]
MILQGQKVNSTDHDVLKGDDPQYPTTEVQNSYVGDYPRYNNQHKLQHDPRSHTSNKKMQKNSAKKIPVGKKGMLMDMNLYKEVSIKYMLFGGEMTSLKKFCTDGSDMKVSCSWTQSKGGHTDALEVVFIALKDVSQSNGYVVGLERQVDRSVSNSEDRGGYHCSKHSKLHGCRNRTDGQANLKRAWSLRPQKTLTNTKPVGVLKKINNTEVSTNDEAVKAKTSTINRLWGIVGLKKPPASSLIAAEIPSSPIEQVSSGDDTESNGITDDNNQPKIKRTTKSTINSDDFSDISMDSDMSSPLEIKKEFIPSNTNPMYNSDGYSPQSEHALMAANSRMGQISQQTFNKFVTNVDKAPSGSNITAIEPESEAEHHEISDIEF